MSIGEISKKKASLVLIGLLISVVLWMGLGSLQSDAQSGSALLLNATATPLSGSFTAQPRNVNSAAVYVTVQSSGGLVSGLEGSNFRVFAEELPPSGCRVSILNARSNNPGVYRLDIVPGNPDCTWERGLYVFSVSVTSGSQSGATLAELRFE